MNDTPVPTAPAPVSPDPAAPAPVPPAPVPPVAPDPTLAALQAQVAQLSIELAAARATPPPAPAAPDPQVAALQAQVAELQAALGAAKEPSEAPFVPPPPVGTRVRYVYDDPLEGTIVQYGEVIEVLSDEAGQPVTARVAWFLGISGPLAGNVLTTEG